MIKRIAILGISGAGKTSFAKQLAHKINLPLYHMDSLYWQENWTLVPQEEWQKQEQQIIEKEKWIIEGYIDPQTTNRLVRADKVIFLDYSGTYCATNILKRSLKYSNVKRPELPENCFDTFNFKFFFTVLRRKERKEICEILANLNVSEKLLIFKTPKQTEKWLKSL